MPKIFAQQQGGVYLVLNNPESGQIVNLPERKAYPPNNFETLLCHGYWTILDPDISNYDVEDILKLANGADL